MKTLVKSIRQSLLLIMFPMTSFLYLVDYKILWQAWGIFFIAVTYLFYVTDYTRNLKK